MKSYNKILIYFALVFADVLLITFADLCAFWTCLGRYFYLSQNFLDYRGVFSYIVLLKLVSFYVFQLYSKTKFKTSFITAIYVLKATTVSALIMALVAYFFRADAIPRPVILLSWLYSTVVLFSWRVMAKRILELFIGKDFFKSHLLIIGTDRAAEEIAMRLLNDATIDYMLIGFIKINEDEKMSSLMGFPVLGSLDSISDRLNEYLVDEAVLASFNLSNKEISKLSAVFKEKGVSSFRISSDIYDGIVSRSTICDDGVPFTPFPSFHGTPIWYPPLKRISDIILSLLLLIAASPIFILIATLIKMTSKGRVYYVTKRVGYMGKVFVMFKFRTMYERSSHNRVERWAAAEDKRVTPIGKILRRFRLDELPQLINVLKNDMSLIGPRPETRYYVNKLLKEIPLYSDRFKVKPGITGWAQVNFGYAASVSESREKFLFDIYYIQNQSLALDMLIILKTIKTVIVGAGVR